MKAVVALLASSIAAFAAQPYLSPSDIKLSLDGKVLFVDLEKSNALLAVDAATARCIKDRMKHRKGRKMLLTNQIAKTFSFRSMERYG